jgi:hypothetical protein
MADVTVLRREMETERFARQEGEQHIAAVERVDVRGLEADLRKRVRGEVRFDRGARALYATDGSNYRQVPLGVVIPRDKEDVIEAVGIVRQHGAPLLSRGCGTSLAGTRSGHAFALYARRHVGQQLLWYPLTAQRQRWTGTALV